MKNCGSFDKHAELLFSKKAPMTTDAFSEQIVNKVESVVKATNAGVTYGFVIIEIVDAVIVVVAVIMGIMIANNNPKPAKNT